LTFGRRTSRRPIGTELAKPYGVFSRQETAMPSKTASQASSTNAIELLKKDHQEVLAMFDDFEKIKDKKDDDLKHELVERICTELTIHSQIEEELFYPALRDAFDDQSLLDEAEVEHTMASMLISELESMEPGDDLYDAKVTVLGEYVRHHIDEEQEQMFPKARKAGVDLEELGLELFERKDELLTEFGMPDTDEDAIEADKD
jgi:hemerythrin-like domain-containing protein